ncbi:Ferric uptake regulation protein [Rubripirellula amarantea]|uniref:Ferric uptake regulation protein n=2 Tax=Rubripirellula amarantea TaxID=2527999 RepID=A0A5C5WW19_9BACT|nr:Ferric uptake regulation protein [Rubripirellula amarantea]
MTTVPWKWSKIKRIIKSNKSGADMNSSKDKPSGKEGSANDPLVQIQGDIRAAGLRATPARTATLILLRESTSPLSHAEVADHLAQTGVDKATAFRNLNDMAEAGLLRRSELGDHVWRFEAIDPTQSDAHVHPHFLCVDCGSVACLDDVELTAHSQRQSDRVGQVTEILLRGHCNDCR